MVREYIYFCKIYTQIYYSVGNGFRSYEKVFFKFINKKYIII
ncbi:hypothetical protein CCAN12_460003 [Capnocytophaga canimorsus]|uniref:Uncharacterized protein n=1 Tax=Capnocytophaga canimorsus TaxID=28188 RepID=A0A0B7H7X1_9FLAO|nr:hypothetical protein CCAN12_460003 [Capnocytophaga canimorsus]